MVTWKVRIPMQMKSIIFEIFHPPTFNLLYYREKRIIGSLIVAAGSILGGIFGWLIAMYDVLAANWIQYNNVLTLNPYCDDIICSVFSNK